MTTSRTSVENNTRFVKNAGKHLFKSVTLSVGDTAVQMPEGYYCPKCRFYLKDSTKCSNKVIDYDKLLKVAGKQFNYMFETYSDLYDYLKQSYLTEKDLDDQSFWITCNTDMVFKQKHTIDTSVVVDRCDGEFMQYWNMLNQPKNQN